MKKIKQLLDEYWFPGFRPKAVIKGKFGDNKARIIYLIRHQKKLNAAVAEQCIGASMIARPKLSEIYPVATQEFICQRKCGELIV